jgi:OOP family OmpA-OmpF porin
MISIKNITYLSLIACAIAITPACKSKKPLVQPTPVAEPVKTAPPVEEAKPAPAPEPAETAPAPVKPDYNFSNIQFEFNSAVLKTGAYVILDKASLEMKKDASAKFVLNGYASNEGTAEHNLALSQERASAVKLYLVNSGISGDNLTAKGYGEANPVAKGDDEVSRALNRRVEVKKQ